MTDRDEATGLDAPRIIAELLLDIEADDGVLRISTTREDVVISGETGGPYTYVAAGGLFRVAAINESSGIDGTGFSVIVPRATPELLADALKSDLADRDIRLSFAIGTRVESMGHEISTTYRRYVLKRGKISNIRIDGREMTIEAYTPMTTNATVRRHATVWTHDEQTTYVDDTDFIFRFLAESAEQNIEL